MDLTRLVLAHQPISKISTMPKLGRSSNFVNTRARLNGITDANFSDMLSYMMHTEFYGELSPIFRWYPGMHRAAFLRDSATFTYYYNRRNVNWVELWYPLSVDEPGITQICIDHIKSDRNINFDCNTVDTINWTPELIAALKSPATADQIVESAAKNISFARFLEGFLDFPDTHNGESTSYFLGQIRRIVPPGKEYQYNADAQELFEKFYSMFRYHALEIMTRSAYLFPLLELSQGKNHNLANGAYYNFRYEILEKLAEINFSFEYKGDEFLAPDVSQIATVTRDKIPTIERIVANPKIMATFTKQMRDAYFLILGYQLDRIALPGQLRRNVMNPGEEYNISQEKETRESVQSLVLYNPDYYTEIVDDPSGNLAAYEKIRQGKK